MQSFLNCCRVALLFGSLCFHSSLFAQGTAFSYQGRLTDQGAPANGEYDVAFTLFDSLQGGNQVGPRVTSAPTSVNDGLFSVTLDFGVGVFPGSHRWLEIEVRPHGQVGGFTTLSPRQQITASPYAITAASAGTAASLSGVINGSAIAAGSITSAQLGAGVAVENLRASGQSGVGSGGIIFSSDGNSSGLQNAGYAKIGQAELGQLWQARGFNGPLAARYRGNAVWTGTEWLVWGGDNGSVFFNDGRRYNPTLNSWAQIILRQSCRALTPYSSLELERK